MSDGALIALEEGGSGPSLLLVHGSATTRMSWGRLMPFLQPHFHTYAMNRRGRVDSTDGSTYSLAREAQDIVQVVQNLPGPVCVFGHSYGALAVFQALPAAVGIKRAVLYEPPIVIPGGMPRMPPTSVCSAVAAGDNDRAMVSFLKDYVQLTPQAIAAFRTDPSWPQRIRLAPTVCRESKEVSTYVFDPARFAKVETPTEFLLGGASSNEMAHGVREAAASLPHGSVHILPGQQHVATQTAPKMLADAITDFLSA